MSESTQKLRTIEEPGTGSSSSSGRSRMEEDTTYLLYRVLRTTKNQHEREFFISQPFGSQSPGWPTVSEFDLDPLSSSLSSFGMALDTQIVPPSLRDHHHTSCSIRIKTSISAVVVVFPGGRQSKNIHLVRGSSSMDSCGNSKRAILSVPPEGASFRRKY